MTTYSPITTAPLSTDMDVIAHPFNVDGGLSYMVIKAEELAMPFNRGINKWAPVPSDSEFQSIADNPPAPEDHYAVVLRATQIDPVTGNHTHTYTLSNPDYVEGPHFDKSMGTHWAPMSVANDHDEVEARNQASHILQKYQAKTLDG